MIIYQNLRENFFNYISESKTLNKIDKIANKKAIFVLATVGVAGAVALFCTGFTAFAITGVAVTGTVVAASLLFKKMMQSAKNAENINPEQNLESDIQNIVQTSFSTNTSFNESLDDAIASFRDLLDKEKINEPQKLIDLFFNKLNALKDNNEDSNTIDNFIAKYKKNILLDFNIIESCIDHSNTSTFNTIPTPNISRESLIYFLNYLHNDAANKLNEIKNDNNYINFIFEYQNHLIKVINIQFKNPGCNKITEEFLEKPKELIGELLKPKEKTES